MNNITIKTSDRHIPDSIIYELMKIEADVYIPEYRGDHASILRRFQKNKDMFILAYDGEMLIGYLCYFPISKRLHDEIISSPKLYDDDILPDDVMPFGRENYIYFLSIALYQSYHGMGIGTMMAEAFFRKMKQEKQAGNDIVDIIASVVSSHGEKIVNKFGFSLLKDLSESEQYKLYYLGGSSI